MLTRMSFRLIVLLLFIAPHAAEQSFLGTHFYLNQDKIFVDNTLKSVSTLARPYDLVAFIRQAERLERVEQLQTYIDAVDEVTETTEHQQINSIDPDPIDSNDKCNDFLRDGESLIFKILKTRLYDTFYIPFELKNISLQPPRDRDTTKILTCSHFCHVDTSKFFSEFLCSEGHCFLFKVSSHSIICPALPHAMKNSKRFMSTTMKRIIPILSITINRRLGPPVN